MDCSLPDTSVHGISQTRIVEWIAISFSRGSSQLRDWTHVFCLAEIFFTTEPPGKPSFNMSMLLVYYSLLLNPVESAIVRMYHICPFVIGNLCHFMLLSCFSEHSYTSCSVCSRPGFPVLHPLPELAQNYVH